MAVVLIATVFTACGDEDDPVEGAQTSTIVAPSTTAAASPIIVRDFSFSGLEVKAGSRVLVQNQGPAEHSLTAEDNSFDTKPIPPGTNVQFTVPSRVGTYKVKCTIHPTRMTGELKVT